MPADIAAEARKYTPNVVKLVTPNATWANVKAAAQGANVFVYLGHGNGWPSIYPPFQTLTKDGLGLDPSGGADGSRHVYYGEDYIRDNIQFAPNAVVLLYHLCYASGNTEPGLAQGTFAEARERVDNYGAGFIGAGARVVIAEGHPDHPATHEIDALFTTNRTMDQVFRTAAVRGTATCRVPSRPSARRASRSRWTRTRRRRRASTARSSATSACGPRRDGRAAGADVGRPRDFAVPGAAEVVAPGGVGLFGSHARAPRPEGDGRHELPAGHAPADHARGRAGADGTRIFAVTRLGTSVDGYVRATGLAPRDSTRRRSRGRSTGAVRCSRRTPTASTMRSSSRRASPSPSRRR